MVFKGFRFGMLLQIAVGPICLFIFQTAVDSGFPMALMSVFGVALADAAYIFLAIGGVGALLRRNRKTIPVIRCLGAFVLIGFGLSILFGAFGLELIPSFHLKATEGSAFVKAFVLTLSNPMSIVFWAGVFSTRLAQDGMDRRKACLFGAGSVLSTLLFLSFMAALGSACGIFISESMTAMLNAAVGAVLIGFGVRTAYRTKKKTPD